MKPSSPSFQEANCQRRHMCLHRFPQHQYALESSSQPLGISRYELTRLIPEDFKGSMPTIEEIEAELAGPEGGQDA